MANDLPSGSTPPDDRSRTGGKTDPSDWIATPPPVEEGEDWLTAENLPVTPLPAEPMLGVSPISGPTAREPLDPVEPPESVNLGHVAQSPPGSDVDLGRIIPGAEAGTSSFFGGGSSLELSLPPQVPGGSGEIFTGGSSMELPALPKEPPAAPLWSGSSIDLPAVPEDPEDALADLPPINPTAPASGWFDSASPDEPTVMPPPRDRSDVFVELDRGESDVIRGLSAPPPSGSSSIFDAPAPGSSRFHNPSDATEEVTADIPVADPVGPDSGSVFDSLSSGRRSLSDSGDVLGSDFFASDLSGKAGRPEDSGLDFNQVLSDESGSNLFPDLTGSGQGLGLSEVNLLDPMDESVTRRSSEAHESSIFSSPLMPDPSNLNDDLPLSGSGDGRKLESIHDAEDSEAGGSHIFKKGIPTRRDPGTVSFEMPTERQGPDEVSHESGNIDWSVPMADDSAVSQLLSEEDARSAAVPSDLGGTTEVEQRDAGSNIFDALAKTQSTKPQPVPTARTTGPERVVSDPTTTPRPGSWESEGKGRPSSWIAEKESKPAAARRGGAGGWIGGTAIGMFVGMAACAAAYFGGLVPGFKQEVAPIRRSEQPPAPENQMSLAEAQAALTSGDPTRALQIYERSRQDLSPMDQANRGGARLLARIQKHDPRATLAADDAELKLAEQDLQAALDAADKLVGNERLAAVQAALHLGMMKELTGDRTGAARIYREAATRFKDQSHVFTAALTRLQVTQPTTGTGQLTPDQREELVHIAFLSLFLLQAPKGGKPADKNESEAGFLFWEATGHAAAGDFARAVASINRARAIHEKRRLLLAGRGLNPLSDPLEQIFLKACDELRDFWKLKADLYAHPVAGPLVRQGGVTDAIAKVLSAPATKSSDDTTRKLAEAMKEIELIRAKAETERKTFTDTAAAFETKLKTADQELTKTATERKKIQDQLAVSQKMLDERVREVAEATRKADDAQKKLTAADAALAVVVRELKASKLVDEKDDAASVLAKMPEILKKASAAAASTDAQKAAIALLDVQKQLEAARAESKETAARLRASQDEATRAAQIAEKATADAEARLKAVQTKLDEKVKEAVAAARARDQVELKQLEQESRDLAALLKKTQEEHAEKLAIREAEYAARLAAARSGHAVPITSAEVQNRERAARLFADGASAYHNRRLDRAERDLVEATRLDPTDARYWYFLGMARFDQGKPAEADFKKGAELEDRRMPHPRVVDGALEGVYGPAKAALRTYRR